MLGGVGPEELVQRHVVAERERRARVRDRGLDLAAVADDRRVAEETLHVALAEPRDALRIEAFEGGAEPVALAQDRDPRQTRLEPLEAEPLVEAALVEH